MVRTHSTTLEFFRIRQVADQGLPRFPRERMRLLRTVRPSPTPSRPHRGLAETLPKDGQGRPGLNCRAEAGRHRRSSPESFEEALADFVAEQRWSRVTTLRLPADRGLLHSGYALSHGRAAYRERNGPTAEIVPKLPVWRANPEASKISEVMTKRPAPPPGNRRSASAERADASAARQIPDSSSKGRMVHALELGERDRRVAKLFGRELPPRTTKKR